MHNQALTAPTKEQAVLITQNQLNPNNWLVASDNKAEMEIISIHSRQRRFLQKKRKRARKS